MKEASERTGAWVWVSERNVKKNWKLAKSLVNNK